MGRDEALGARALAPTRVGLALAHHPMLASRAAGRRRHKTRIDGVRQMMNLERERHLQTKMRTDAPEA
jgi:hypothetical protein